MTTRQIAKKVGGYLDEFFDLAGTTVRQLLDKIKKDKDHIYIVHSGADFTGDFDPTKIGTGEGRLFSSKNYAFRPMGDGMYGYVLDPNNVKEFDRAFSESARTYAEWWGGRTHIFKVDKKDVKKQIPWTFKKKKLYGGEQDPDLNYDYAVERVGNPEGGLTEIRVNPKKAIRVSDPQILTKDGTEFRKFDRYINKPSDTRGPAIDLDKFDDLLRKKYPKKETYEYKGGTGKTGGGRPIISSKNNRFNKGGNVMAMEQQMEMFGTGDMGRLNDDGMMNDPVSGNPIPPGSMANEVRDDVDAKLSDGEYVVPANVVRYYGVKFFEDLRNDAMQGLATMEATGRIGGEPVPAEMPMQDQMAGAANELSEQDMAMLQSMMNEGGVVQGYANGGGVDPVTGKPIPQAIPTSYYPISQFITPGASTISSGLNPYINPAPPSKITGPGNEADGTVRYVTYEKPGTGEIRVIAFKGDTPVNPDEVTSAIEAGYFPQGSSELESAKQKMARDPEQDQSVDDGTKPPNRQTVGELLWSVSRGTYNSAFPDSLSAGVSKLGSALGTGKVLGSILPDGPSALEASIKEAKERLASGKDYQGVAINAAEKAALELLAGLDPTADPKVIYDTIYNAYGIHLGGSQKGKYKRDIRKPDLKKATETPPVVDTSGKDLTPEGGAKIVAPTGVSKTLTKEIRDEDLGGVGGGPIGSTPTGRTATYGGGMTGSDDRPDDPRGEGQYGGGSNSQPSSSDSSSSGAVSQSRPAPMRPSVSSYTGVGGGSSGAYQKGGLLKKPTKKKKTKTKK